MIVGRASPDGHLCRRYGACGRHMSRVLRLQAGRRDRLTDFTRALTGAYYFVPSIEALAAFASEP